MSSKHQQQQDAVVEAPSSFLCPIHMEIMEDPVTLHTGISYDRASIETWLRTGHNTCPITNQPLPHRDLIPNHALRSAILAWRHAHENANPGFVDELHELTTLLHSIAHSGAHHLPSQLHQLARALPRLDDDKKLALFRDPNLCTSTLAGKLCCLLYNSSSSTLTKVNAAEILDTLYEWDPTLYIGDPTHGHPEAAIQGLVTLLKEESSTSTSVLTSGLRCLLSICLVSKKNRVVAIEWEAVNVLVDLLIISQKKNRIPNRRPNAEYCCRVLEVLATCAEGREAISAHPFGVTRIAEALLGVSNAATEHAVGALSGLLSLATDRRGVMEAAMQAGVFTRLLMVMSSECNQQAKGKAKRMLKMLNEVC